MEPVPNSRFRRWVLTGAAFLAWNVLVVTVAIAVSSGSSGENMGKFIGTVGSAIAFIPPAWFVWRAVQQQADGDKRARAELHSDHDHGRRLATEGTVRQD